MALASTMDDVLMIFFILSFIVDVKTIPVQVQKFKISSIPLEKNSNDVYCSTTTDSTEAGNNVHLNVSTYEEMTHNPLDINSLTHSLSWITLPVETNVSYTSSTPPDEKSTYVNPSTMMLTTIDSTDIENRPHHNMSINEEVTYNPSNIIITTLIPSLFTLRVETQETSNSSGTPSIENNIDIDSSTTTVSSLDPVELFNNATLIGSKNVEVTHNLLAIDGSNISHLFKPVKSHTNNSSGGPLTESSTRVYPSNIIFTTTTDSTDTENFPFNMSNYKDVCGRQLLPMPKIVGGDKVSFGEWPWQISLRHKKKFIHKCGAVLFNENWAITTAHCVVNVPMNDVHLILGKHDFSVNDEPYGFLNRTLQTVIIHPKYNTYSMEHDLALLRFNEPVKFQPNILPVCIPEDDSNFAGYSAHVTGWGALYYGGHSPTALQVVTVPVLNNSVCETMFRTAGYKKKISDTFICAGSEDGGYDACKGDSGGPMVVQRSDNRWVVAGIISWGMRCGEPNSPGVYMRISKFKDWINQIILQP